MMNNPWKGLASYEESDINRYKFCGRAKSIEELASLVINNLFVTLYGRTGIGKTSLLKAGVFPLLRRASYVPVLIRFSESDARFADEIIARIEEEIPDIRANEYTKVTDDQMDDLWEYFATRRFYNAEGAEVYPVVVLDQFEENFLRLGQKNKVELLLEQLYSLIDDNKEFPEGYHNETNFRVVLSIREDDLFRLEDSIDSLKLLEFKYNRYRLVQLTDAEARDIIEIPGAELLPTDEAERTALIADILGQIKKGDEESLSTLMLSLVCSQLYERAVAVADKERPQITRAVISSMEGNGLKEFYLRIIQKSLPEVERYALEDLLVDESGRRNSVNDTVFKRRVPSWRKLTEGSDRILQTTNGKVELVHDMLAAAIFEVRLERQKAEEERRLAEEEVKRIKQRNLRIRVAGLLVMFFVAWFAALYIYYQNTQLNEANHQMRVAQSRAVGEKVLRTIDEEDGVVATKVALEILPEDLNHPWDKVYTPEAEHALRAALNHPITILTGHTGGVSSVAVSPDGSRIVSGSWDKTIRIWDAETGEQIGEPLVGHTNCVSSVTFSPDGKRIVSGSYDETIRIWDVETGEQIGDPLVGHTSGVGSVVFSPDGKKIASSDDEKIRIWDAATGVQIGDLSVGFSEVNIPVAFSPDGKLIASGSFNVGIGDAETYENIPKPFMGHGNVICSVAFSPDGKRIVSGSYQEIRIWDVKTGKQIGEPLVGHTGFVNSVAFSPNGKRIVSGSEDGTIRIWDAETGEQIGKPLIGHTDSVESVAFSPDGQRIVSGSEDGTIRIWDMEIGRYLVGHTSGVNYVFFSPDGQRLVSNSWDNTVRFWDIKTGEQIGEPIVGQSNYLFCAAIDPNGRRILSGSADGTLYLWDAETGELVGEPFEGHTVPVTMAVASPDGKRIVSGSRDDGMIWVWDGKTHWKIAKLTDSIKEVSCIAISSNRKKVVSGSEDGTICIWDAETGKQISESPFGHTDFVNSVAFSPDGSRIASGSWDGTIRIWDAETGEQIGVPLGHTDAVISVAFSPDGEKIVSGLWDGTICVWDVEKRVQLDEIRVNQGYALFVSFSPDGRKIVAGFKSGMIRLWEWKPLQELMDEARERFKNRELTPEERRKYYLD